MQKRRRHLNRDDRDGARAPEFDSVGYREHLRAGGAPFGGKFNASIRDALETYGELVDELRSLNEPKPDAAASEREAMLRAGIEDSVSALCHLLKQTGKPDLDDVVRRVVTNVVPRLHKVLNGENPYGA